MSEPLIVKKCPINASGNEITFYYHEVEAANGSPAPIIESARKLYTLKGWNSELLEVTYTRAADTIQTPAEEPKAMTTPAPQPEKVTAAELRAQFNQLTRQLDEMRAELDNNADLIHQVKSQLEELVTGLQATLTRAASIPSAPADSITFTMTAVTLATDENGKTTYKARGPQYMKFGVRIWPEVLPVLGIDPETLKPGVNNLARPLEVRAATAPHTNKDTGETSQQPHKVIGLA